MVQRDQRIALHIRYAFRPSRRGNLLAIVQRSRLTLTAHALRQKIEDRNSRTLIILIAAFLSLFLPFTQRGLPDKSIMFDVRPDHRPRKKFVRNDAIPPT